MRARLLVVGISLLILAVSMAFPTVLNLVFDGIDLALGWAGSLTVVLLVSALTGVLFILAFPHVSAQGWIVSVKDRIKYNLLAIRIFQDNLKSVLSSTAGTLGWNFAYLGLNILPMVILAGPFMAVWFQLNAHYAFEPLQVGEERLVSVELRGPEEGEAVDPARVEVLPATGEGLVENWRVAGPIVRLDTSDPDGRPRLLIPIEATAPGSGALLLRYQGEEVLKGLEVETRPQRLAQVRTAEPWDEFLATRDPLVWFGEPILPADSFVRTVFVDYDAAPLGPFGGGEITIMVLFVIVSLAVGFGLKGRFGVEI